MNVGDEHSRSYWMYDSFPIPASQLVDDAQADVAVVGGGIAGLSIADELGNMDDGSS